MAKTKKITIYRSSKDGEIVSPKFTKKHPSATEKERRVKKAK